jgi:hypothetical protein
MANAMQVQLPVAKKHTVSLTADGSKLGILAEIGEHQAVGFCLATGQQADVFVADIIAAAASGGTSSPPTPSGNYTMTGKPIMTSGLGIAPGRVPSEAFIVIKVGALNLTFAIDVETVLSSLRNLEARVVKTVNKPKPQ